MAESPTGRGYPQGSGSYLQTDADRERREMALARARREILCTCRGSDFWMDIDRCPVHGKGCT